MGIVLSHTIVALFLHYRNRDRHFAQGALEQNSSSERFLDQEALSSLENVTRIRDLYSTIREVLTTLLHRNVNSIVYIADEKSGELYADREKNHVAPSHGIVRETIETQQFHVQSTDVAEDPVVAVLKAQCKLQSNWIPKTVYCLPVTDEENQKILALIVIEDSVTVEINKIVPLKQKIVGCYRRLCKCHRDSSSNYAPSSMPNSTPAAGGSADKDAILRLCGDLYDQDASRLQLKVIRFLEEQTNAECAFLLLVVPETQELFCQVIGGLVLEEEVKFPGQNSVFSLPLDSKKPMKLEDVPLDKRKEIENFVGVKLKSLLCVPVSSRNSDGLIALACVVNKKDAENFSNEDLQTILQCFQYTSTVLTSTLAFQNERKLKLQTQAMLQVARNLFTHLGEFSLKHNEELVSYSNLTQFLAMYKEQVTIPNRKRRESVHKNSNGSAKTYHSISLTESTSYRPGQRHSLSSLNDSLLEERSSKYFRSQLETSSGEKVDSHHTECSESSQQKSIFRRKYFSSVYVQTNEDSIDTENEDLSHSFEKEVKTVQLPLESEYIHKTEEREVKQCHLEGNIEVVPADSYDPVSGESDSSLTQVESEAAEECSGKNVPAIVDDSSQLKEVSSIPPPSLDVSSTDLALTEPKEDSDQNKAGNQVEMLKKINVQVEEQSKSDSIAADNSLLIETPGDKSGTSTTEEIRDIQPSKAESEHCVVTEESICVEANNNTQPNEQNQMETSNTTEIGVSCLEQNLAEKAHSEPGSSSSIITSTQPEVLDMEHKSKDNIGAQMNSSIRMIESVKEDVVIIESESDNDLNDSVLSSMSPLKTAVTNDMDKVGMKHIGTVDTGKSRLEMDTLKVPSLASEQLTIKSFRTARDETVESTVESPPASDQEVDVEDSDEKIEVFYDTFTERSINSSVSEQGLYNSLLDRSMMESPSPSPELKTREVRLSKSDQVISKQSMLRSEYKESRPSLNYAFVEDVESFTDPLRKWSSDLESVIEGLGLVASSSSPTTISIKIIVENTTSQETHYFSHQKVPNLSAHSSFDNFSKRGSGCSFEKFDRDLEYIKQQQPPTTDVLNVTINDLTKLLREIMQEARNLTQAERCSVFLIDKETKELVAEVFDGISTNSKEEYNEIRMPITQGIAGHVATTGKLLNIKDAYSHPMFYRGIDDSTGFRTRNILCFPIKNEKGDVLGVAQLCNKKTGQHFTEFDEDLASAFAVYCCISISHSLMYQNVLAAQYRNSLANELMMYHMKCLMYKKLQDSQHRNSIANELMIYHMQISPDDVEKLLQRDIPSVTLWGEEFDKFPFPPREIPDPDTPLSVLAMFEDLGFNSRWRIRKDTLVRFVLMVKKGYRNPPYHNWTHAFAVAHFCYLCVKNLNLQHSLDDIELLALFVSCLCHDLDHRGTNNQYQLASKSVLAALYSSEGSVMERHHFAQTMCIVNTEGCNIFENLSSKDYTSVLDLVRDIILATDLSHHLKIMNSLKEMAKVGYDNKNERHHSLLLCLLMTASDLSDQTKPWDNTKHVAALIYREFFSQGDMEKSLGQKPAEMMDRERARIPDLQIGFLDHIALPVYKLLADLFPASEIVRDTVVDNRRHWEKICALIKIRRGGSCEQMSYDQILALEEEEANAEIENYNLQNQKQNGR